MSSTAPIKLVITGTMGAGKTTAISALSEIPPVVTDVPMTTEAANSPEKSTTTVALDYGELTLDSGRKLLLFGTPGQRRYEFMCRILVTGALGVVMLVDASSPTALVDFSYFLDLYAAELRRDALVIGLTHMDGAANGSLKPYREVLARRGARCPVFAVDSRRPEHVTMLIEVLIASLEFADEPFPQ